MLKEQVAELKSVIEDFKAVIADETTQVSEIIATLEEKVKDFEGLDISSELEELKAAKERIAAISGVDEEEPVEEPV